MWINPHFGGWVIQNGDKNHKNHKKINEKNMPMKCVLGYSKSFQTNFFSYKGGAPLWALDAPLGALGVLPP